MRARVKGRTENALLRLPFKAAYMFRPAAIPPVTRRTFEDHGLSRVAYRDETVTAIAPLSLPEIRFS